MRCTYIPFTCNTLLLYLKINIYTKKNRAMNRESLSSRFIQHKQISCYNKRDLKSYFS